jgi:hypothetical protein
MLDRAGLAAANDVAVASGVVDVACEILDVQIAAVAPAEPDRARDRRLLRLVDAVGPAGPVSLYSPRPVAARLDTPPSSLDHGHWLPTRARPFVAAVMSTTGNDDVSTTTTCSRDLGVADGCVRVVVISLLQLLTTVLAASLPGRLRPIGRRPHLGATERAEEESYSHGPTLLQVGTHCRADTNAGRFDQAHSRHADGLIVSYLREVRT